MHSRSSEKGPKSWHLQVGRTDVAKDSRSLSLLAVFDKITARQAAEDFVPSIDMLTEIEVTAKDEEDEDRNVVVSGNYTPMQEH